MTACEFEGVSLMMLFVGLVIMVALAVFFYRAAEFEDLSAPALWGGGSALLYLGAVYWLDWGVCGALALQLALFVAMALWIQFDKHRGDLSIRKIRERRNTRRGLCAKCGYDLRGSVGRAECPECGEPIVRQPEPEP